MLNEKKEYEQYTVSLDDESPVLRLKHRNICNHLSGISRAMTIIARNAVYRDDPEKKNFSEEEIASVRILLQEWCGDINIRTGHFPRKEEEKQLPGDNLSGWLTAYIVDILGRRKIREIGIIIADFSVEIIKNNLESIADYEKLRQKYEEVEKNFACESFYDRNIKITLKENMRQLRILCENMGIKNQKLKAGLRSAERIVKTMDDLQRKYGEVGFRSKMFDDKIFRKPKNDFKAITYDKIIADAITAGPLKRYYLVCEKDSFPDIKYIGKNVFARKTTKRGKERPWSDPTMKKADLILKIVAAYCLEKKLRGENPPYSGYVPINLTDIFNWKMGDTGRDSLTDYTVSVKTEDGRIQDDNLFEKDSMDNVAMLGINSKWMKDCGWEVIEEKDLDQYFLGRKNEGAVYYSDWGAGKYLKKNILYDD